MGNTRHIGILLLLSACFLTACDTVSRHKVLSTVFDGIPTLPPPEQLCSEFADQKVAEMRNELAGKKNAVIEVAAKIESVHPPYEQKKCDNCHDKSKDSGLIRPPNELCFVCHKNFFQGDFLHGPAAVGDCLACHVPHSSPEGPLLKTGREAICAVCHRELRSALSLHEKVAERKLVCVDCHSPHDGNSPFFLK